jgi:hypothetical protein
MEWFRMDVPVRLRPLVGKTTWKQSLRTTDKTLAAIKRAQLTSDHKAEIVRLDGLLAGQELREARDLVDRSLELLAAKVGSLDHIIRSFLTLMTLSARQSWSIGHERRAAWDFGLVFHTCPDDDEEADDEPLPPYPGFDSEDDREGFIMRQKLIEGRGLADGIVLQEVAQRLLDHHAWDNVYCELLMLLDTVGVELVLHTLKYEAAAKHFLERLATHRFCDWQPKLRQSLAPLVVGTDLQPRESSGMPRPSFSENDVSLTTAGGNPVSIVFANWRASSNARDKTKDEFERGVMLFIRHYGDVSVELITKRMVVDWKKLLLQLPSRASKQIADLLPAEQIQKATELGLPRIGSQSATKYFQALRTTLKHARDEMLVFEGELPTQGVSIDVDEDERVEVAAFSDDQLRLIFNHPVMTDPNEGDDEVYWFLLIAPLTGCRVEETAQLDEGAQGLLSVIERPDLGREVHLALSSITAVESGLAAKIRIIEGKKERGRPPHETGNFSMILSSASVTIASIEWDGFSQ